MRVALIDDHPVFRSGLKALLSTQPDVEVIAEGTDAPDAYAIAERARPDLFVVDVNLPGPSGIDATRELCRLSPRSRVLILSMYLDAARASSAFAAGATGYACKADPPRVVLEAVRAVARGERWLPAGIGDTLQHSAPAGDPLGALSKREREIFSLLVAGLSNRAAAKELGISVKTVETHRTSIHRKLGVHSVAQLLRFAAMHGLIDR